MAAWTSHSRADVYPTISSCQIILLWKVDKTTCNVCRWKEVTRKEGWQQQQQGRCRFPDQRQKEEGRSVAAVALCCSHGGTARPLPAGGCASKHCEKTPGPGNDSAAQAPRWCSFPGRSRKGFQQAAWMSLLFAVFSTFRWLSRSLS